MNSKLGILVFCMWIHQTSSAALSCDDATWTKAVEGKETLCFKTIVFNKSVHYEAGKYLCESEYNAFPSPFRGEADRVAIRQAIDRSAYIKRPSWEYYGFYIGIKNIASSANSKPDFRVEPDSKPIKFTSWIRGEPNRLIDNKTNEYEQCVTVVLRNNLDWNDRQCSHRILAGIICAKPPTKEALQFSKVIHYLANKSDGLTKVLKNWNGTVLAVNPVGSSFAELTIPLK